MSGILFVIQILLVESQNEDVLTDGRSSGASISMDGWTSRITENYAVVNVHYINKNWEMETACLDCSELMTASAIGQ